MLPAYILPKLGKMYMPGEQFMWLISSFEFEPRSLESKSRKWRGKNHAIKISHNAPPKCRTRFFSRFSAETLFPEFYPGHLVTVCARWRALIIHCPSLWGHVLGEKKSVSMYRLAVPLALSKQCPLHIRFVEELKGTWWNEFKKAIAPHA